MKTLCFVGTAAPVGKAHNAVVDLLNPKTALAGSNGWTGVLEHQGKSQEVNVFQVNSTEDATTMRADWIVIAERTDKSPIESPISRKSSGEADYITIYVDQKNNCASEAVERATQLLRSYVCGTHPLGQQPSGSDPHLDRYRSLWTPARN